MLFVESRLNLRRRESPMNIIVGLVDGIEARMILISATSSAGSNITIFC